MSIRDLMAEEPEESRVAAPGDVDVFDEVYEAAPRWSSLVEFLTELRRPHSYDERHSLVCEAITTGVLHAKDTPVYVRLRDRPVQRGRVDLPGIFVGGDDRLPGYLVVVPVPLSPGRETTISVRAEEVSTVPPQPILPGCAS